MMHLDRFPRPHSLRWRHAFLSAVAAASLGLLTGCPPATPKNDAGLAQRIAQEPAVIVGADPVGEVGGLFIPIGNPQPRTGAALTKALESLDQIAADTAKSIGNDEVSSPAAAPAPASTTETADTEPPPMALKYYLLGREKYQEQAYSDAIEYLDKALSLDPQAFTVLQLMAQACFDSRQLPRGSQYLVRAHKLRPQDVQVNSLLGRYWMLRQDWPQAIYYLLAAERSPERDPATAVAAENSFYFGGALQAAGYHLAAARQFAGFLQLMESPEAAYRYDGALNQLMDDEWKVHFTAAENFYVVGHYADALPHYQQALVDAPGDSYIAARLATCEVRLRLADAAINDAVQVVTDAHGSDESIALLIWTYRQLGHEGQMLQDLRHRLSGQADDGGAALALASVQQKLQKYNEALDTLAGYQQRHPTDLAVVDPIVRLARQTQRIDIGFIAIIRALHAQPEKLADLRTNLAGLIGDKPDEPALSRLEAVTVDAPSLVAQRALLLAIVANAADDAAKARQYFLAALAADPHFWPTRETYLEFLLAKEGFEPARQLVQEAIEKHEGGARAYELYIESEVAQDRYASALKIAQEAKDNFPDNAPIRLALASVYQIRGETKQAQSELLQFIEKFPKDSTGYERLVSFFIQDGDLDQAKEALAQMSHEFPENRFARLLNARFAARDQNLTDAEQTLNELIKEKPDDPEPLIQLATIQVLKRQPDAGLKLLKEAADKPPSSPLLVGSLVELYDQLDRHDEAAAVAEKYAKANPDSEALTLQWIATLIRLDRRNDADAALKDAVRHFPRSDAVVELDTQFLVQNDRAADAVSLLQDFIQRNGPTTARLYRLSSLLEEAGHFDQCVAMLQHVLELMPDHTGANNDLGYYWADRGEHLEEAERLINRALENEPNNAAFMDSLAWVYYKGGKFAEAVTELEQAVALPEGREADVYAHLGDALWRVGRKSDAIERWRAADALAAESSGSPADKTRAYLARLLKQIADKQEPTISPIAVP